MIPLHERQTQGSAASWSVQVLAAVCVLDALLLVAHVWHRSGPALGAQDRWFFPLRRAALWSGGLDGSLLELFGLLQLGAAAVLLLAAGLRGPAHRVLAAWGGVLLLLVADDLCRIHERVGARLALDRLVPSLGETTAQELGGLLFWAVSGLVLVGGLVRLHLRSGAAARSASWTLLATVVPFVLVAVGYVLLGAARPDLFDDGSGAEIAALVRITVKLLTMTLLLGHALRLSAARP